MILKTRESVSDYIRTKYFGSVREVEITWNPNLLVYSVRVRSYTGEWIGFTFDSTGISTDVISRMLDLYLSKKETIGEEEFYQELKSLYEGCIVHIFSSPSIPTHTVCIYTRDMEEVAIHTFPFGAFEVTLEKFKEGEI